MAIKVLVTGAESAKALIVARALGRYGYRVYTFGHSKHAAAGHSKYCSGHHAYPYSDETGFIDNLREMIEKNDIDILMPTHSVDTSLILKNRILLDKFCRIPFVDYDRYVVANDKAEIARLAKKIGIRIPATWLFGEISELRQRADEIVFPAVVKLRDQSGAKGLSYVHTKNELFRNVEACVMGNRLTAGQFPIIQEYIPGVGYGTSVLYDQGSARAVFTHRRIREYPSTGGSSTLRISDKHEGMEEIALHLMDKLNWHGLAMVEFRLDSRTNEPVLLEVNPRVWGSIYTAIVSGVNFPVLLCKIAMKQTFSQVTAYRVGVKTRFLLLDALSYPGYFGTSRNRWQLFRDYLPDASKLDIEDFSDLRGTLAYYLLKTIEGRA